MIASVATADRPVWMTGVGDAVGIELRKKCWIEGAQIGRPFEDAPPREDHGTGAALSIEVWKDLLRRAGFRRIVVIGTETVRSTAASKDHLLGDIHPIGETGPGKALQFEVFHPRGETSSETVRQSTRNEVVRGHRNTQGKEVPKNDDRGVRSAEVL